MSWTDHPEGQARCDDPPGAVGDGETVARLLHSGIFPPPGKEAFRRQDLQAPKGRSLVNTCGASDGASLVRCDALSDEEIRKRATDFADAGVKPRMSEGGVKATVADIRGIPHPADASSSAFRVYDDPKPDDTFHAVLRCDSGLPDTDFDKVRSDLHKAFSTRVLPKMVP